MCDYKYFFRQRSASVRSFDLHQNRTASTSSCSNCSYEPIWGNTSSLARHDNTQKIMSNILPTRCLVSVKNNPESHSGPSSQHVQQPRTAKSNTKPQPGPCSLYAQQQRSTELQSGASSHCSQQPRGPKSNSEPQPGRCSHFAQQLRSTKSNEESQPGFPSHNPQQSRNAKSNTKLEFGAPPYHAQQPCNSKSSAEPQPGISSAPPAPWYLIHKSSNTISPSSGLCKVRPDLKRSPIVDMKLLKSLKLNTLGPTVDPRLIHPAMESPVDAKYKAGVTAPQAKKTKNTQGLHKVLASVKADEMEKYATENSPSHISLRSSLSDLTVDGSVAGIVRYVHTFVCFLLIS